MTVYHGHGHGTATVIMTNHNFLSDNDITILSPCIYMIYIIDGDRTILRQSRDSHVQKCNRCMISNRHGRCL